MLTALHLTFSFFPTFFLLQFIYLFCDIKSKCNLHNENPGETHLHNVKVLRLALRHKPLTTLADIFRVSAKNNLI